jgi:ligand-binding SRPBCC domain-containing protein
VQECLPLAPAAAAVIPFRWRTLIAAWSPPHTVVDRQLRGAYRIRIRTHRFSDVAGGALIEEEVIYSLSFGMVGALAAPLVVRHLKRIFDYRCRRILGPFVGRPIRMGV